MNTKPLKMTVAAVAVAAAVGGAYSLGQNVPFSNAEAAAQPVAATVAPSTPVVTPAGLPDMRSIVATNAPAVVNISGSHSRHAATRPQRPVLPVLP